MIDKRLILAVVFGGLAQSVEVQAETIQRPSGLPELTIVADHGGTSARPYFVAIGGAGVDEHEGYSPRHQPFGEQDMLPVHSQHMSPGTVKPQSLDLPRGFTPVFLIGDDPLSKQWLIQRRDILREIGAVGLVVQVEDEQSLQALRKIANTLELRPVSGDALGQRLGLQHYPALISQRGIEQ